MSLFSSIFKLYNDINFPPSCCSIVVFARLLLLFCAISYALVVNVLVSRVLCVDISIVIHVKCHSWPSNSIVQAT